MGGAFAFNNQWNNFNWGNSFSSPWSSTATTSSSKSSKPETYEEYKKRVQEEIEAKKKKLAEQNLFAEMNAAKEETLKPMQKSLEEIEKPLADIKANKQSDGSSTTRVENKKLGFWGKAGRWLSNAGTAVVNMGKSLVGIEKDGSWNWKKCVKNVAITAAAVGACFIPVVGPFIGYALAAYGIGAGAYGVYKGSQKLDKAKTDKEIDEAQQDICANAIVGITSVFGLRGIGKAFRTSNATASTATTTASSATSRTGLVGKAVENSSNFVRDITVNAWRGTKQAAVADKALIAAKGGGINGFRKAYGAKVSDAWKAITDTKTKYDKQHAELEKSLNDKMNKLNDEITQIQQLNRTNGGLTPAESQRYALLKEEKLILERNLQEFNQYFNNVKEKSLYENLSKDNSATKAASRFESRAASANPNKIQGKQIPDEQLAMFNQRILSEQQKYSKALNELIKSKENLMRTYAKAPDKYGHILNKYVPSPQVQRAWYKPSTWNKTDYQLAIGGSNPANYGTFGKIMLTSPASSVPKTIGALYDPIYSAPFMYGQDLSAEETEAMIKDLEEQRKNIEASIKQIKDIKTPEEWAQFVAQAKAAAEQQAAAQAQAQAQGAQG